MDLHCVENKTLFSMSILAFSLTKHPNRTVIFTFWLSGYLTINNPLPPASAFADSDETNKNFNDGVHTM